MATITHGEENAQPDAIISGGVGEVRTESAILRSTHGAPNAAPSAENVVTGALRMRMPESPSDADYGSGAHCLSDGSTSTLTGES
ncbi:unnamed protein product [Lampetra fluviatilis]